MYINVQNVNMKFVSMICAVTIYFRLCMWCHLLSFQRRQLFSFFPDQTPFFIGRNLQSVAYPVEMMKWLWSTMKVTFGRWTAFIFIAAEFLNYVPLIKHETHPLLRFSVTSVLAPVPRSVGESRVHQNKSYGQFLWFDFSAWWRHDRSLILLLD